MLTTHSTLKNLTLEIAEFREDGTYTSMYNALSVADNSLLRCLGTLEDMNIDHNAARPIYLQLSRRHLDNCTLHSPVREIKPCESSILLPALHNPPPTIPPPPLAPLRRVKIGFQGTCTDPHILGLETIQRLVSGQATIGIHRPRTRSSAHRVRVRHHDISVEFVYDPDFAED